MAIHENLKPSDQELPLLLAGKALTGVRSLASRPTGTISVENPDGTSTIIGAGGDGTDGIAQQVGKTSQPGTPTGLSVSATGLTVSLMWDGTSDGIEENAGLAATLTDESGTSIRMGETPGAGTLVATATVPGLAHVTARTYDNAHDTDGNPSRNLSQPATLDIVLSEIVDSQAIDDQIKQVNRTLDDNKQALDQANTDLADARKSADSALAQAAGALAQASAARTAADSASTAASSASSKADEAQKAADNAASAASSASSKADKAQRSADSASNAASAAASTASDASKTAGDAKTIAGQAQDAASKASSAASNAQTIAGQAQSTAGEAKTAASDAQKTAGEAKTAADDASKTAGDAKSAAGKAQSTADSAASNARAALVNANSALAKAKNITFQKTAPSDPAKGDVWYPLDDSGHAIGMRTWDGVNWGDVTLVAGKLIVPGSIGSTLIADGAVTAPKITAGAVTADKLAANSVSADKLAANSVTGDKIAANSVMADKIAAEAITGDKIAANSISTSKLTISAGNLFSNPTFAGDASRFGATDRVDNVTFPDGSTGSTVAIKMDVTGMNPNVCDSEWIPCNRGDVFYVGVWLSYADDSYSVPQGKALYLGLDTRGDSSESWPTYGAPGLTIDTSEVPRNGGTGDKWKYFYTYVPCPATGVTRFWLDTYTNSHGFHLLVWRPTVIRAADAKLIVNGSITADKIQGNRLIGTEIQTSDKPPYMRLTSNASDQYSMSNGILQFTDKNGQLAGGMFVTSAPGKNDSMTEFNILVSRPDRADDPDYGNYIRISDQQSNADGRYIDIASSTISMMANDDYSGNGTDTAFSRFYLDSRGMTYMAAGRGDGSTLQGFVPAHVRLFDNDSWRKNGNVSIMQQPGNDGPTYIWDDFDFLDIQFRTRDDGNGFYQSMRVYRPASNTFVGMRFTLSTALTASGNTMWLKSQTYHFIDERTLDTVSEDNNKWWRCGQMNVSSHHFDGGDQIMITRIEGWYGGLEG